MAEPGAEPGTLLLGPADDAMAQRLARLAGELGLVVRELGAAVDAPDVVVIDLDDARSREQVAACRARWPGAVLAAYLATPDPATWVAAQRAGADLVANRGALVARLRVLLTDTLRSERRFPLLDAASAAGRLGLIARFADTPAGPVALYRAGGRLCAIQDRCPHAGGVLSDGELAGTVLTCPLHGSQFDVVTGARERGPADEDIRALRLVEEGGQIALVIPVQA
jgi:nitrite reductase/ring-hydroxylating ferredoxin subunit